MAQWLTNPTRNHEVAGSVPALLSGLTIQRCRELWCRLQTRAPMAYGGSQARGPVGAIAIGLHQSHSNAGSEPHLQPTPQLTATLDR